jgi:hypothetical protein
VLWLLVPWVIAGALSGLPGSTLPTGLGFYYAFGLAIVGLQVLGALTKGMAVSVPFVSGAYVTEAYFLWSAVDGGVLSLTTQGITIGLSFQTLLFLLMLPSLFGAVKTPIEYLLERSEAGSPAPEAV